MAVVTNLTADKEEICPDERVLIEATTSDGSLVSWFVNGTAIEATSFAEGVDGNSLDIGQTPEDPTIVKAQSVLPNGEVSSLAVEVVNIRVAARIEVEPGPTSAGHVISAEPRMPAITAGVVANGEFEFVRWHVSADFMANDCPPHGPAGLATHHELPPISNAEVIIPDFGDLIRGGGLSFRIEGQVRGCAVFTSAGAGLVGTNPNQSDIQDALPHNTLRAIACKESGQRQFTAPANGGTSFCPLFGHNGAVGVMGLHEPTDDEVWNWRSNVQKGIEKFNERVEQAKAYPGQVRDSEAFQRLVTDFNAVRIELGLESIQIDLPEFTSGDFDSDLQQVELDAIRGFDGWEGRDEFGLELHEFRVAMDRGQGEPLLRVVNFDQSQLRGEATWERVPVSERPAGDADPLYVHGVLAFLLSGGCSSDDAEVTCGIRIEVSTQARTFSAAPVGSGFDSGSLTAGESLVARTGNLPAGSAIHWQNDSPSEWLGSVVFAPSTGTSVEMLARHPNKSRIVAKVIVGGEAVCTSPPISISVPQFFHLSINLAFDEDLQRLGLIRRPPPFGILTPEQVQTNAAVRLAVLDVVVQTARFRYNGLNVRFTLVDPSASVGDDNVTTVSIGGDSPMESAFGEGPIDPGNVHGSGSASVFTGELSNRKPGELGTDPEFLKIMQGLAVEDRYGNVLPGTAVDAGEFVPLDAAPTPPNLVRKLTVRAAVLVVGRWIGTIVAHECGHALGLDHNFLGTGRLMDDGKVQTFFNNTGLNSFDPATGALNIADLATFGGLGNIHFRQLEVILPTSLGS